MASDHPLFALGEVCRDFTIGHGFGTRKRINAVDNVSLVVRAGETLAIVGESGSGKTTLAKMMMGLLAPSRGQILLDDRPLSAWSRRDIARQVQFVFQDPYSSLNPRHPISRIIAQPLVIHGVGDGQQRDKSVREMLDVVGLPQRTFDAYPSQISGGQRQRVVIARALILRPKVLICDEPTSALDVSVQSQILNLLLDLRSQFGLTYIIVSHNLSVVEHMADRVAVMYLGRVVELSASSDLFKRPQHPYTRVLLRSEMTIAPGAGIPEVSVGSGALPKGSGCAFLPRCPEARGLCARVGPELHKSGTSYVECHLVPYERLAC
jgi:peptide/nickel transport system ATP-binding protein